MLKLTNVQVIVAFFPIRLVRLDKVEIKTSKREIVRLFQFRSRIREERKKRDERKGRGESQREREGESEYSRERGKRKPVYER